MRIEKTISLSDILKIAAILIGIIVAGSQIQIQQQVSKSDIKDLATRLDNHIRDSRELEKEFVRKDLHIKDMEIIKERWQVILTELQEMRKSLRNKQ